jgi:microsomal dipeptidase-like Zn-dependent dipeptidase
LRAAGYKDQDIRAIVGGNFLRVASQVWAPG